jgi:hypothetical protein
MSWTQLGSTIPITAMPITANVGLMGTASYNPQLTVATFNNVNVVTTTETFAVQNGSTLDINLSSAGPVSISQSGSTLSASQNGVQALFTGITAITVTDTASGDTLNFNGLITAPLTFTSTNGSIVNVNTGTLTFAAVPGGSIRLGSLSIAAGAYAAITPTTTDSATTMTLNSLSIGSNATFDVANNIVLINYGSDPDPISTVASDIAGGYFNGLWTGYGIISSAAQTNSQYALGYADSADPGNPANLPAGTIEDQIHPASATPTSTASSTPSTSASSPPTSTRAPPAGTRGDFNYDPASSAPSTSATSPPISTRAPTSPPPCRPQQPPLSRPPPAKRRRL